MRLLMEPFAPPLEPSLDAAGAARVGAGRPARACCVFASAILARVARAGRELPTDGVADPGGVEDESLDDPNVMVSGLSLATAAALRTSCQFQTRQNMPMEEQTQQVTMARRTPAAT